MGTSVMAMNRRPVNPWDDDDLRAPRPAGWGCAIAAIIGSITAVILLVVVAKLASSLILDYVQP